MENNTPKEIIVASDAVSEEQMNSCTEEVDVSQDEANTETADSNNIADTTVVSKKSSNNKPLLIGIIAAILLIFGITIYSQVALTGDDKIAYELVLNAADEFKNPSSVRLVSGVVGVDKDCLYCGISALNGFGNRKTGYYYVSYIGILDADELDDYGLNSLYRDKSELNFDKINSKLEKALKNRY